MDKCITPRCKNAPTRFAKSNKCSKCRRKERVAKDPIKYAYDKLRHRAKERGIPFNLSLADYTKFWHETGYGLKKGKTAGSLSIDRIDASKGYEAGNIQAITLAENSYKKAQHDFEARGGRHLIAWSPAGGVL